MEYGMYYASGLPTVMAQLGLLKLDIVHKA